MSVFARRVLWRCSFFPFLCFQMEYPPSPTTVKGVKLIQQAYRIPAGAFGRLQFLVMKDTRASDKISAALNIDITNVEGVRSFVQHVKTNLLGDHFKMDLVVMSEPSDEDIEADGHGAGEEFLFGFSFVFPALYDFPLK